MTAAPRERYAELDGVRGIAIALTLLCNTSIVPWASLADKLWSTVASAGWVGVQLFFVLSGFLITGILIRTQGRPSYFGDFYTRRALRILPPYILVLSVAMLALHLRGTSTPDHPLCYWLFVSNFCIAEAGRWSADHFGVTWSLAVEEHFYLVWPFLVAALNRKQLIVACCIVLAGSLLLRYAMTLYGYSGLTIYVITPTRLDGLAAGSLIAIMMHNRIDASLARRIGFALMSAGGVAAGLVVLAARNFNYDTPIVQTVGYTAFTAFASGLVLFLVATREKDNALRHAMRWRPLAALGFYSYAIYLYHPIPHYIVTRLPAFQSEHLAEFPGGTLAGQIVATLLISAATVALAVPSYHLFERRFLDMRRSQSMGSAPGAA